jgi:hypothetical protein
MPADEETINENPSHNSGLLSSNGQRFKGKAVVVTGGGSGIAFRLLRDLCLEGASVAYPGAKCG